MLSLALEKEKSKAKKQEKSTLLPFSNEMYVRQWVNIILKRMCLRKRMLNQWKLKKM